MAGTRLFFFCLNDSKLTAEHPCQDKPTSDLEVGRTCQVLRTRHPRESRVSCQPKLTSDLPGSAVHSWWLYRSPSTTFGTQVNTLEHRNRANPLFMDWLGLAASAVSRLRTGKFPCLPSATVASNRAERIAHSFSGNEASMNRLQNFTTEQQNICCHSSSI